MRASNSSLGSLFQMVGAHKGKMALACIFSLLTQLLGIAPFIILYFLIDRLAVGGAETASPGMVWPFIGAAVVCLVFKYVFSGLSSTLSHASAYDILYDLRIAIAERLPRLPLGFFNQTASGQIKKVMLEDVEQMEIFIGHNLPDLVGSFLYLLLSMGVLFCVDWRLAILSICLLPIGIVAQALTVSRNKDMRGKYFTANENANAAMVQYIQGMPVIKAFTRTESSFKAYADSVSECAYYEAEMCKRWSTPMTIFTMCINANMLLILPVGALMYLNGSITLSVLLLFLLMGLGLGATLHQLMTLGSFLEHQVEGRKRIDYLLSYPTLPETTQPLKPADSSVGLKDVSFAYAEQEVLRNVSVNLNPGQFLALVGPSGAGKSTLARLIPRFWDVKSGSISLGGTDIRNMTMDDLMDHVSFVFQDIFLFNDTIEANLRIGKADATKEEIETAAKMAQCHDFIMSLEGGYAHVVGEKGSVISGGEKQRICIARALLKNSPVLVLDEATAFIDPENEAKIQKALNALVRDKTLIVVAHRLSTITSADEIMVLDGGAVVARGTHEHLLETNPLYQKMWAAHMSSKDWNLTATEALA